MVALTVVVSTLDPRRALPMVAGENWRSRPGQARDREGNGGIEGGVAGW